MSDIVFLILSLLIILASAEIFTNGVESFGRRFSLSQAVVGSLLAAVGTALPETILPLVAILMHPGETAKEIGVGAILGAPFMLGTLAFFLIGLTILINFLRKRRNFELFIEPHSLRRDLLFFIVMYSVAIFAPMVMHESKLIIAILLVIGYVIYAYMTFRGESADLMAGEGLYLARFMVRGLGLLKARGTAHEVDLIQKMTNVPAILFQVLLALGLMVEGAHTFVGSLQHLSAVWGVSPLLFALLIAPIATELPEKFNSVTWTLKGRDTLAMGNITGAMVFQATFPVTVGLLFTDWNISGSALFSAVLALVSAVMVLADVLVRKRVSPVTILLGGLLYLIYALSIIIS